MKTILHTLLLLLIIFKVNAQTDTTSIVRPFQVTFVPPIGTNGVQSHKITNQFSFNMLIGVNGGVDGFELGGLINTIKGNVEGAQISGFGNLVTGNVNAAQIGGFFNINGGYTEGLQLAGFTNIVGDSTKSLQVAGFGNLCGQSQGAQISGFGNIAGNMDGLQIGGFGNISGNITGVQGAGFTNIAGNIDGLQAAGFLNLAGNVKGVQIAGFLNICDSIDGIPIAPISIVKKNGYIRAEFWTNEMFFLNASFNIGVRKFYTIYTLGYKPGLDDYNWSFGFGAGTSFSLGENTSFDPQANVTHFFTDLWKSYNQLNQIRLNFNYQVSENLGIFAGPSFNLLISEFEEDASYIAPDWSFNFTSGRNALKGWFGFNLGLRFL